MLFNLRTFNSKTDFSSFMISHIPFYSSNSTATIGNHWIIFIFMYFAINLSGTFMKSFLCPLWAWGYYWRKPALVRWGRVSYTMLRQTEINTQTVEKYYKLKRWMRVPQRTHTGIYDKAWLGWVWRRQKPAKIGGQNIQSRGNLSCGCPDKIKEGVLFKRMQGLESLNSKNKWWSSRIWRLEAIRVQITWNSGGIWKVRVEM